MLNSGAASFALYEMLLYVANFDYFCTLLLHQDLFINETVIFYIIHTVVGYGCPRTGDTDSHHQRTFQGG